MFFYPQCVHYWNESLLHTTTIKTHKILYLFPLSNIIIAHHTSAVKYKYVGECAIFLTINNNFVLDLLSILGSVS